MSESHESRPRADSAEIAFRKIFIGGLSYSTDEDKLKKYFQVYGTVQDAVVMKDPVSKRSRGFGFITFYDISSVDNALAHEPHTIDQRKVEAKRAVPRSEIAKEGSTSSNKSYVPSSGSTPNKFSSPTSSPLIGTHKSNSSPTSGYSDGKFSSENKINLEDYTYNKIFVGGLHYDTRDPEFKSYFEKYGRVVSAEVMFNRETHKSRGFGFIVFETEDSAIKVCNEKEHVIDGKVVEVKRAIPRSKIFNNVNGTNLQMSSDDSPTSITNIRSDVRRTMSTGSAQFLNSSILSSNSSTLAASAGVQKGLQSSSSIPTQRKPFSNAVSPSNTKAAPPSGSYAAALKIGGSGEDDVKAELRSLLSSNLSSNSLSAMDNGIGTHSTMELNSENELMDLNALLRQSRLDTVRTVRALSEPIVKFDSGGIFGKDVFTMDLHSYGASTPPNSLNSSRSSSIYLTNSNLGSLFSGNDSNFNNNLSSSAGLNTMPWLSSPSSGLSAFDNSVDNNSLLSLNLPPPISASKNDNPQVSPGIIGSNNSSSNNSRIESINSESHHSFMQFPVSIESDNSKAKSLFATPPRSGISVLSDSAQKSHATRSNIESGVVPSPEKWAAMFGVSGSQGNNGYLNLIPDQSWPKNNIFSNNFQENSLFGDFEDSNSRVLGIATTSLRSGTTTTESSEGLNTANNTRRNSHPSVPMSSDAFDVNTVSQYSDLRLDSQEFIPQGTSLWNSAP